MKLVAQRSRQLEFIQPEHGQGQHHKDHYGGDDGRRLLQQELQVQAGTKKGHQQAGQGVRHCHAEDIADTQCEAAGRTGLFLPGNDAGQNRYHGENARGKGQQQAAHKKQADDQAKGLVLHPLIEGVGIFGLQCVEKAWASAGVRRRCWRSGHRLFCRLRIGELEGFFGWRVAQGVFNAALVAHFQFRIHQGHAIQGECQIQAIEVHLDVAEDFVGFGFAGGQGQFGKIVDHIAVGVAQCESKTVLVKIHLVDQLEIQQQLLVIPVRIGHQLDGFIHGRQAFFFAEQFVGASPGQWGQQNDGDQETLPALLHSILLSGAVCAGLRDAWM